MLMKRTAAEEKRIIAVNNKTREGMQIQIEIPGVIIPTVGMEAGVIFPQVIPDFRRMQIPTLLQVFCEGLKCLYQQQGHQQETLPPVK